MMGKEKTGEKGWGGGEGGVLQQSKGLPWRQRSGERDGQTHGTTYKSERMEKGRARS